MTFFQKFVASPATVGAVLPSSRALASTIVEAVDWSAARTVVEYGPGTGVFTARLAERAGPEVRLIAIERDADFAERLTRRHPTVHVVCDSAASVAEICRPEEVDAVVSGLPWTLFPADLRAAILDATLAVLKPGGQFLTFAYLQGLLMTSGRKFRGELRRRFARVETSRIVWGNVPPAFVYLCRKESQSESRTGIRTPPTIT